MKQSTPTTTVPTTARALKTGAPKKTSKQVASTPPQSATSSPTSIKVELDLGDRHSHFCVLDAGGVPHEQGKVAMLHKDLAAFFQRVALARLDQPARDNRGGSVISRERCLKIVDNYRRASEELAFAA